MQAIILYIASSTLTVFNVATMAMLKLFERSTLKPKLVDLFLLILAI